MKREGNVNYLTESSDDDDDEDTLMIKRVQQDHKLWDSFQDPPLEQTSGSAVTQKYLVTLIKALKIFTYIFVFLIILITGCLSKMSFLLMTSNIKAGTKNRFCDTREPEKQFEAIIPTEQRIAWMWAICFSFGIPEIGTFIRAARICFFKNIQNPKTGQFLLVLFVEIAHVIGMGILSFNILPNLDVIKGLMLTNCICLFPGILNLISHSIHEPKIVMKYLMDLIAICSQITGFVVWPLLSELNRAWFIPVALFSISIYWWENFLSSQSSLTFIAKLASCREDLSESRYKMHLVIAPLKVLLLISIATYLSDVNCMDFFTEFNNGWNNHTIRVQEMEAILNDDLSQLTSIIAELDNLDVFASPNAIFCVCLVQIISSYVCYAFSKWACKIHIQSFSMAFPINLVVPTTVTLLLIFCGIRENNVCVFHGILPDYIFFKMPPIFYLFEYVVNEYMWLWLLWLISQAWITRHLWMPKCDKNASTEKLFVCPMYNGLLIDQSIAMNRRKDEQDDFVKKIDFGKLKDAERGGNAIDARVLERKMEDQVRATDKIPQVLICATMWHENKEEMMEFLKSILRLDEDQCARRMAMKHIQANVDEIDPDYYDLETHIFFDDAFVGDKSKCETPDCCPINSYVRLLVRHLEDAALEVYKTKIYIAPPTKIVTPYGGRLIWILPGRTKMIGHLKDKNKIRHKKRWSQVMYMYYLLGYRIMQLATTPERKLVISQNTYLLALDGDIDFQPKAVQLLINRMKIDPDLGAACGRIHPIGSGPMVWYQIFEYAIGHWLQKATEHVIGCVLCSPGCFSLFRGRALMENSVMKKYTTTADQARHYVQYDQGEDRWLCTLLLKQSFRVEYAAASDAYTHSPEGFNEFYNQRRRWIPSTMANIMDLLGDAKRTIEINNSISMPFIIYQGMLMVGTILGPGTIFLMMVGALVAVFQIDIWIAFQWNFIPMVIFMGTCYVAKQKYQLIAAFIISIIYALVMMAVLVGVMMQIMEDGILAPASMFFVGVCLQIIITGLLHPQEIIALPTGIIYYVTIPSMYMLLIIYSLFNMNDVSWGTRENPTPAEAAKPQANNKNQMQKIFGYFKSADEEEASFDISLNGLFRCMFCTHPKSNKEGDQLIQIAASLAALDLKMRDLEMKLTGGITVMKSEDDLDDMACLDMRADSPMLSEKKDCLEEKPPTYLVDWLYDEDLKDCHTDTISSAEEQFWIDLIEKYLKPKDLSENDKKKVQDQLKNLRDLSVFAFVMLNALFVLVVFLLQLNKENLHIEWMLNAKNEIIYNEGTFEILIKREYLELEPIGLMFVLFFGVIIMIQFISMLIHRFGTISQILANTSLNLYCSKKAKELSLDSELRENAVDIAMRLQKPKPQWDETDLEDEQRAIGKRQTIHRILYQHKNSVQDWSNLEANFKREFYKDGDLNLGQKLTISRKTMYALDTRRKTMAEQRKIRKSVLQSGLQYQQPNSEGNWYNSGNSQVPPPEYDVGQNKDGHLNFAYERDESEESSSSSSSSNENDYGSNSMEMQERPTRRMSRK